MPHRSKPPAPEPGQPVVCLISLGCAKNQVDSERLAGALAQEGFLVASDPADADLALVNTCSFLKAARSETMRTLAELQELKKRTRLKAVIAAGCYPSSEQSVPGADLVLPFDKYAELAAVCRRALGLPSRERWAEPPEVLGSSPRLRFGDKRTAYLKISEGCDNRCAYCRIPSIRGPMKSRPAEAVIDEALELVADGARELVLIAQDTAAYGRDLPGGRTNLAVLMRRLLDVAGYRWLRLMYAHPAHLTDEVIELFGERRLAKYLDMPIQHADTDVLAAMNRPYGEKDLRALIEKLRGRCPEIALRTTCLVGFPGETRQAFQKLLSFVAEVQFDHLGGFAYSREPLTPAARMKHQVSLSVRERRLEMLLRVQKLLSDLRGQERVGAQLTVLIEAPGSGGSAARGRSQYQAPEVDGKVVITAPHAGLASLRPGRFHRVMITGARGYDLVARLI
jgi:ribosomal protein S12 methylthiotransferase